MIKERTLQETLNSLVLDQCKDFLAKSATFKDNYEELDILAIISQLNTELWEIMCSLTQSISDNLKSSSSEDTSPASRNLKMVRRFFFFLRMILYCTDDHCSLPMHILIADLVDSQGEGGENI